MLCLERLAEASLRPTKNDSEFQLVRASPAGASEHPVLFDVFGHAVVGRLFCSRMDRWKQKTDLEESK